MGESTTRRHLDLLTDAFMVRQLRPWHANLRKRQVRSPKIYIRDSGLLHQLLGIASERDLMTHPKLGASWAGYAIEEVLAAGEAESAYFWATHQGAEIDLVLHKNGRMLGVECKRTKASRMTAPMRIALESLKLDRIAVVYPGEKRFAPAPKVEPVPLTSIATDSLFEERS